MKNPETWLEDLHNQYRSLNRKIEGCKIILEEIEANQDITVSGFVKEDLDLRKVVAKELEQLLLESSDGPVEIHACVYEWKEGSMLVKTKEGKLLELVTPVARMKN